MHVGAVRLRFCGLLAALVACSTLLGQLTLSTVRGTVIDPTGAVVSAAAITLTNLETNAKRDVKTSDTGDFEIPDLQRGTYRLSATASGFKTFVADDIILEGSQIRRINVTLEVGAVGTEVTVNAGAAVIQTDSAKLQTDINTSRHFDNPWVGGMATLDPSLFITTAPLVNQSNGVWSSQWAGQNSNQVQEGQDGHTNDNAVNQLNDILDAQEITVVTTNNTAEFARVGYMNLVTKSGSNEFHGQAAYWNDNSAFAARQFFDDAEAEGADSHHCRERRGPDHQGQIVLLRLGEHPEDPEQVSSSWRRADQPDADWRLFAIADPELPGDHQGPAQRATVPEQHDSDEPYQLRCRRLSTRTTSRRRIGAAPTRWPTTTASRSPSRRTTTSAKILPSGSITRSPARTASWAA